MPRAPAPPRKPGRPKKDQVGERVRIYRASGPLILANGVRGVTVRELARASHLSPGGIYHYFRSKADLALYGLEPEGLSRACTEAARELTGTLACHRAAAASTIVRLYVEKSVAMLEFVRPALHAAIELGRPELRGRLAAGLREDSDSLVRALESLDPPVEVVPGAAEALRRVTLGLALDESVTGREAGRELTWLFSRLLPQPPGPQPPGP